MKHQWFIVAALWLPLALYAQSETVRTLRPAQSPERSVSTEQSFFMKDTPKMRRTPDSLTRVETSTIHYYTDTLLEVSFHPDSVLRQRTDTIRLDSTERRGHYIEAHIGAGYGSLGYKLDGSENRVDGTVSALIQLQYAYFFHSHWGIGIGAWYTNYCSYARIGSAYQWLDQTDTDLEQHYDHTATVNRWRERELIHNVGVPVSLQFQYSKENWKARIFAAAGAAPAFAVSKRYQVLEGEVAHSGYYPNWKLTLEDIHEFGTKDYTKAECAKGTLSLRTQVAVFADFGTLIPMSRQTDLFLGAYFNYTVTDANGSEKKPLGWKDDTFTFMESYNGAYATDMASASHPWEAGLKIGIHWHHLDKEKHKKVKYFDYFTRQDTAVQLLSRCDTVVTSRIDTLTRAHIVQAAKRVEKFNNIYFALDSYQLTPQAKQYLSSIVGILKQVPDAKISVDGHASEDGNRSHNEKLAYNRAKVVADYLISKGIKKNRVIVIGHGSLIPNAENTGGDLSLDRRTEVKIVQKQSEIQ